jgi:ParB-like chromosome segregation protein Spo0J
LAVEVGAVLCSAPAIEPAAGSVEPVDPPIKTGPLPWRNRIVGHADVAPDELVANPSNPRRHPAPQRAALRGSLDSVGWVAQATLNVRTGNLVDGHARLEEALRRHEPTIPVTFVDLSPDEERLVIATLDPIGAMATLDSAKLDELLAALAPDNDALVGLLDDLARANDLDALRAGLTDPDDAGPLPEPAAVTVRPGER